MEKIILIKEELACNIKSAFSMFTENKFLEAWLTEKANVEPILGGKYELFWDPENPEDNSTIDCKITGLEKDKLVSFEWKGPKEYKHFMNSADPLTHVIVFFSQDFENLDKTTIHFFHTGWRSDSDWQKARDYFQIAWIKAIKSLKEKIKKNLL